MIYYSRQWSIRQCLKGHEIDYKISFGSSKEKMRRDVAIFYLDDLVRLLLWLFSHLLITSIG